MTSGSLEFVGYTKLSDLSTSPFERQYTFEKNCVPTLYNLSIRSKSVHKVIDNVCSKTWPFSDKYQIAQKWFQSHAL